MEERNIKLSNKIYPIFYGFSSDLVFWIAINTLFLTTVKHLNASQINTINFIVTLVAIVVQLFYKIDFKQSIKDYNIDHKNKEFNLYFVSKKIIIIIEIKKQIKKQQIFGTN